MIDHSMNCRGEVGPKTIILLVFLSLFTVLILQNTEVVRIKLLFWELSLSRVILLMGSLLTGILIGMFIGWEFSSKDRLVSKSDKP